MPSKSRLYILAAFMSTYVVIGIISPYISILVRGLGYSPSVVGLLLGCFEAAGIAGPFVLGRLVDRWGRYKPGLLICVVLMLLPGIPLAYTGHPLASALLLCVLAVGTKSSIPLTEAMTTLVVGKEGNYGKLRSFSSIAFICSVLFFQWFPLLPRNNSLNIGIWISITSLAALVFVLILPARLSAQGPRQAGGSSASGPWLRNPRFILGLIMIALNRIAMAPVLSFLSLYVTERVRWDAVGLVWAIAAAAETPLIFFSQRIIRYFKGPLRVIFFTGFALILRLLIYAFLPYPPAVIAGQLLHSLCYGLFHPAAVAFISANVPPEHRATGMTIYISLGTGLPAFLGNILGGFILEYFGYSLLYGGYTVFAILAMGVYFVIRRSGDYR
ncbi:MAG: MFS transporter [Treponema sp.]|jgi:PPP family 3-phenylpropionic acid transporter|nr:MFS transporter [Treponema sp.]